MTQHTGADSRRSLLVGILACAASALCFGWLGVLGLFIMRTGTPRSTMIAWRFIIAAAVLGTFLVVARRRVGRGRQVWQPMLSGVVYGAMTASYFLAISRISAGVAALLLYTMPVMVVLLAVARRTQLLTKTIVLALMLSIGGLAISLLGAGVRVSVVGLAGGFGSALLYTLYYTGIETMPPNTDRLTASTLVCVGAGIGITGYSLVRGEFGLPAPAAYGWQITIALVCTVGGIGLLTIGIHLAGASVAAVISCLEPISAVLLGSAILGEPFGPPQWLGTTAVVAAVVLLSLPRPRAGANLGRVSSPP